MFPPGFHHNNPLRVCRFTRPRSQRDRLRAEPLNFFKGSRKRVHWGLLNEDLFSDPAMTLPPTVIRPPPEGEIVVGQKDLAEPPLHRLVKASTEVNRGLVE